MEGRLPPPAARRTFTLKSSSVSGAEKCQQQVKIATRPKQKGFDDPMFGMGCDGNEVRGITPDLIAAPIGDFDAGSPDGRSTWPNKELLQ